MRESTASKDQRAAALKHVRALAQALGDLGRAWDHLYASENHGAARPGSPAQKEADFLSDWCRGHYADPGGSISAVVFARMTVAIDHLQATKQLFLAKDCGVFSVWATGRAFLEMAATVHWLVETGTEPQERLGRIINDRLESLWGAKTLIERGMLPELAVSIDPENRSADLLERARKMGYETIKTGKRL